MRLVVAVSVVERMLDSLRNHHARRPSCPPELTLGVSSRSSSPSFSSGHMNNHLSYPRRSISNPDDALGVLELSSRCKSKSLTTLHTVGRCKNNVPSPELRRRHRFAKLLKLRLDVEKVRSKIRKAGTNIRGGMESLRTKLSFIGGGGGGGKSDGKSAAERRIIVDYLHSAGGKNGTTKDIYTYAASCSELDDFDCAPQNFSSSLLLTSLNDGKFTSKIALEQLPLGDIRMRIHGYQLQIFLERRETGLDSRHKVVTPYKIGEIDIPIYVNPTSLSFSLDNADDTLCIVGITKGYFARHLSVSSSDVRVPGDYVAGSPVVKRKKKKGFTCGGVTGSDSKDTIISKQTTTAGSAGSSTDDVTNDAEGEGEHIKCHRLRSNTQ